MTRALAPLAAALLAAAAAAQDAPRYVTTSGAASVRETPGGAVVARLPPGAGPIGVTGERAGFLRIGMGERDGWIAASEALDAVPPEHEAAPIPEGLVCGGVEPFWSLRFAESGATWSSPAGEPRAFETLAAAPAEGRRWPVAISADDAALTAIVRPALCSDGMADVTRAWTIDLLLDGTLRTGCCRLPAP